MRADVNVSVRKPGGALGTRCEIKNVNSIRFVGQAIEYEARRQIEIIEDGGTIEQETRLFDPEQGRDALDALEGRGARLPLLPRPRPAAAGARRRLGSTTLEGARCPSCRTTRRRASSSDYGLSPYDAGVLVAERETRGLFRRRAAREGARRQARGELGDQRAVRPPEQGRQGRSPTSRSRRRSSRRSST